jgi:hypothetical protein
MADINPLLREFSIPLAHPTLKLVVTGPSDADGPTVIQGLNDPSVYMNLMGPPFPFLESDRKSWCDQCVAWAGENMAELRVIRGAREAQPESARSDWSKQQWLGKRPFVTAVRDVSKLKDGDSTINGDFVGEIYFARTRFSHILDQNERDRLQAENDALEAGDPRIEYHTGCESTCLFPLNQAFLI